MLIPREHGAWAMLLLPFASALVLAQQLDWLVLPAGIAVVGTFLMREPLVMIWRQTAVWREPRVETQEAQRSLVWCVPAVLICGAILLLRIPVLPLLAMCVAAAVLTVVSSYLIVHNRQRSVLLQISSAAGLNASGLVAWLAVRPEIEPAVVWLCALQFAHSTAALLAVHARLEARIAARTSRDVVVMRRRATAAQIVLVTVAAALAGFNHPFLAAALVLSAGVHLADLARLRDPAFLQIRLQRVGFRELFLSILFSGLVLVGCGELGGSGGVAG